MARCRLMPIFAEPITKEIVPGIIIIQEIFGVFCDRRPDYNAPAASAAWNQAQQLFKQQLFKQL